MTRTITCLTLLAASLLVGCNQGTPGGAGSISSDTKKSSIMQADDTFNLTEPLLSTALKQGERRSVSIGVKRGKNFDEDVRLKFTQLPTGITIEPATPTVKHGDTDVSVSITAAKDAALGDFNVVVTGHPSKGADALVSMKISVDKR